ncbi:MAG TPA: branched-chain amino acid ABC transporter permease [Polyangiaceae bacterium]|nr:branched-chain amino acid ABC transporter permease [Polyangiaceae bacterium]
MSFDATAWSASSSDVNRAAAPPATSAKGWRRLSSGPAAAKTLRAGAWLAALAVLVAAPLLVTDYVLTAILVPVLALALAGIGQNLVTGYAGQLSVGSAAFMSVGAFAAYDVHLRVPGVPLLASFAFGGLVAGLVGLLFGLPSLRIRGFSLVVSTLAAQFFFVWLFTTVGWFSNDSASGVISAPRLEVAGVDLASPAGRYWLSLGVVAPLAWTAHNLVRGRIGRSWMAVRDMEAAAAVVGVNTGRAKLSAFAVGSFYCGVAGTLWAFAYLGTLEPHGLDLDRSFQILFIVILGGLGSPAGPFMGAALVLLFPVLLDRVGGAVAGGSVDPGVLQNAEKIVFGTLVVILLVKQPAGMARLVEVAWVRLSRRRARAA